MANSSNDRTISPNFCRATADGRHRWVEGLVSVAHCSECGYPRYCTCHVNSRVPSAAHVADCRMFECRCSENGWTPQGEHAPVCPLSRPPLSLPASIIDLQISPARDTDKLELTRIVDTYGLRQVRRWLEVLEHIGGFPQ
jgi:hypothetical protein